MHVTVIPDKRDQRDQRDGECGREGRKEGRKDGRNTENMGRGRRNGERWEVGRRERERERDRVRVRVIGRQSGRDREGHALS